MGTLTALNEGFSFFFTDPIIFILIMFGVFFGMIFGCIPGLTAALGVSLLLPFTYTMSAGQGIAMLIAIYVGGISGGLYGSILLNIPGTPASLVTCFDGNPMAKKGLASEALTLGIFSSITGGLVSMVLLATIAPMLARIALLFGPWEYFSLGIMGLSVVVGLVSKDIIKGLIAAVIGVLLAMVGMDPVMGINRFTLGMWQLGAGFPILATLMGFFAFAEILTQLKSLGTQAELIPIQKKMRFFPPWDTIKKSFKALNVGSLIGTAIGILPGVGQTTGSLIAYNQLRQMSKTPELFGTGHYEGVAVSESANNAVNGGALVPMMTLGVPGDVVTSILLGGLIIHGLQPGPLLFRTNPELVGTMFVSFFLSNILMFIIALAFVGVFIRLLRVPIHFLFPVILVMCVLGTFAVNNRLFDVWVLFGCGLLGYAVTQGGFPLPPIILGYILGPIIETNFRTAIVSAGGDITEIFKQPISVGLLIVAVIFMAIPIMGMRKGTQKKT